MRLGLTPSSFRGPFFVRLGSSSALITTLVIGSWFLSETKTPTLQQMSPAIALIRDEETIDTLMTLDSF